MTVKNPVPDAKQVTAIVKAFRFHQAIVNRASIVMDTDSEAAWEAINKHAPEADVLANWIRVYAPQARRRLDAASTRTHDDAAWAAR